MHRLQAKGHPMNMGSRILIGVRLGWDTKAELQLCAVAGGGNDLHLPAEGVHAFAHVFQTVSFPAPLPLLGVKPAPIIVNTNIDHRPAVLNFETDFRCL